MFCTSGQKIIAVLAAAGLLAGALLAAGPAGAAAKGSPWRATDSPGFCGMVAFTDPGFGAKDRGLQISRERDPWDVAKHLTCPTAEHIASVYDRTRDGKKSKTFVNGFLCQTSNRALAKTTGHLARCVSKHGDALSIDWALSGSARPAHATPCTARFIATGFRNANIRFRQPAYLVDHRCGIGGWAAIVADHGKLRRYGFVLDHGELTASEPETLPMLRGLRANSVNYGVVTDVLGRDMFGDTHWPEHRSLPNR